MRESTYNELDMISRGARTWGHSTAVALGGLAPIGGAVMLLLRQKLVFTCGLLTQQRAVTVNVFAVTVPFFFGALNVRRSLFILSANRFFISATNFLEMNKLLNRLDK